MLLSPLIRRTPLPDSHWDYDELGDRGVNFILFIHFSS